MSVPGNDNKIQVIPTFNTKLVAIQKRTGETVPFDAKKIFDAIRKAVAVTHEISDDQTATITQNAIKKLENYKALDDSTVAVNLKYIIHLVGDMHCPAHVRFPDTKIWYNVKLNGKKYAYHSLWDTQIITQCHKWHYMEWQHQLDRCSKKEKQSIMAGTPRDWFSQTATDCRHIYSIAPENSELGRDFLNENITLAEQQILKAGYRLAKVLNDLFG